EDARRAEIVQREDLGRNGAKHRRASAVLVERVDAEASQLRDFEREVRLEELLEILPLFVVHDVIYHTVHFLVLQRRHIDSLHVSVDANDRRNACGKMKIGGVVLDGEGEQLSDVYGSHSDPW